MPRLWKPWQKARRDGAIIRQSPETQHQRAKTGLLVLLSLPQRISSWRKELIQEEMKALLRKLLAAPFGTHPRRPAAFMTAHLVLIIHPPCTHHLPFTHRRLRWPWTISDGPDPSAVLSLALPVDQHPKSAGGSI